MLKRQRPATPPPSSIGPVFLPEGPIRPLQSPHTTDSSQPCPKRQRTRPPPLDGTLRGWLQSESTAPHWESDGEEDWIEDPCDALRPPPLSSTADEYKDANSLLHELHVLNQHRLLFAHPPRDRCIDPNLRVPLNTAYTHTRDPPPGQCQATWADGSSHCPVSPQLARDRLTSRSCCSEGTGEKGLAEEVQFVRRRYEEVNRLLGSLFLSRRREVERVTSSAESSLND